MNEEENAWQQSAMSLRASGQGASGCSAKASRSATVHVAAISRPFSATTSGGQPARVRSHRRLTPGWGVENSQVPPPSQASPSG
ncbi:hypothetical protein [Streptomyces rishiriensis]|uniref:hypothetical protein n=1 Tax=Streptomyces rishiriensis TaxID=68264 RepID=UPI0027D8E5B7|nr:hypothetical protein [Streptomyces rishiriensis]